MHNEFQVLCDKFQTDYWSAQFILYVYLYVHIYIQTMLEGY